MKNSALKRFMKRKTAVLGAVIIIVLLLVSVFGPGLCRYDPMEINLLNTYAPSSTDHILGTDSLGRDNFTRLVYGAFTSLSVSIISVLSGGFIGVVIGVVAGYYGGWIDILMMRVTDILLAFPGLLLAIAIVSILGTGIQNTIIAIAIYSIPSIARLVRGEVMQIRESEFIQACKVTGISNMRIIIFHIIPNTISIVVVNTTLRLGTALLTSAGLSFLGLGVQPPDPEWGAMLTRAREAMRITPIAALAPGIAITLAVMGFSLLGDGLRDALDPKLKNS